MGGKRVRIDSKFQSKKCAKRYIGENDRLSQLPDDILLVIISFLTLKEAACTSVLSYRWINVWKHTSCLDFDADSTSNKIGDLYWLRKAERLEYVKWVSSIIGSHKAVTLKEFRICFGLRASANKAIPRWLKFAFAKQVERLELDFSPMNIYFYCTRAKRCVFPEEFLTPSSGGTSTSRPSSRINIKSLKTLSLNCVDVTGEGIEFLLCNCPSLEKLSVCDTNKISNLEVCGPSLILKHLELKCCNNLQAIKVSAPNLTFLALPIIEVLLLENVPMLVELSCKETHYLQSVENLLPALSCCIFQLEILTLELKTMSEAGVVLSMFPEIPKLKKLVIKYSAKGGYESLMGLTSLIRACPYLQEFVLELSSRSRECLVSREVQNTINIPHHHVKVVEFSGYVGGTSDFELVRYILENCVVLEKVIIDPSYCVSRYQGLGLNVERIQRDMVKQQLEAQVPEHVELVIL